MNGNYTGSGGPPVGGDQSPNAEELSGGQKDALRHAVAGIVDETQSYLPEGYHVGSELTSGSGATATVAVDPPAGHPVTAGYSPTPEDLESGLDVDTQQEVAQGLAASAVMQVMDAVGDNITPTAR
ncbi:hypothetical protein halTADL_0605 [Halohasta litchfieldiae]|jgi:hypothetical protein|uniref:Uncharacterized protein n=1 Tax=Halohasta litchfieldiae TaxID=1073996 RepID=A0A1H6UQU9_9EURY|nr:DUF5811 family protein [Halohasta litchfieldiae]ATW87408.1 hypothetical protein halTADL_0605 [Halohasta litchfieldiae]SEI90282.1 hypothetical protein SAMN05444271_11141 [Halohasta litchfieldiae]